jgi:hypothetical protein
MLRRHCGCRVDWTQGLGPHFPSPYKLLARWWGSRISKIHRLRVVTTESKLRFLNWKKAGPVVQNSSATPAPDFRQKGVCTLRSDTSAKPGLSAGIPGGACDGWLLRSRRVAPARSMSSLACAKARLASSSPASSKRSTGYARHFEMRLPRAGFVARRGGCDLHGGGPGESRSASAVAVGHRDPSYADRLFSFNLCHAIVSQTPLEQLVRGGAS